MVVGFSEVAPAVQHFSTFSLMTIIPSGITDCMHMAGKLGILNIPNLLKYLAGVNLVNVESEHQIFHLYCVFIYDAH